MNVAPASVRARSFDAWADDYERYRPGYPNALLDLIAERLGLTPNADVVDLGAGTGKVARTAAARGWRVTAVEPGEPMLDVLRRRASAEGHAIRAVAASAEETGLAAAAYDAALAGEAYHWFDAAAALREMARIVRATGGVSFFWNVVDESRFPLLTAEHELVARYGIDGSSVRRPGPQPETRAALQESGAFEEPEFVQVPHTVAMTGAEYVGLAFTKSHLRTASAEIQDEYRAAFGEVLERHGIAAEDGIEVPYVVDCWIAKRKDR